MEKPHIYIINGANLNMLGRRDHSIYGSDSMADIEAALVERFGKEAELRFHQSNSEGAIIDTIQAIARDGEAKGLVINPGAYAHYSYAIADALADLALAGIPAVEVHISNIAARQQHRHTSVTAASCRGSIAGLGKEGYFLAISYLIEHGA